MPSLCAGAMQRSSLTYAWLCIAMSSLLALIGACGTASVDDGKSAQADLPSVPLGMPERLSVLALHAFLLLASSA